MSLVHMTKIATNHKEAAKKKENNPPFTNHGFFYNRKLYNKLNPTQCAFLEDLVLYIAKGYHPLFFAKNR